MHYEEKLKRYVHDLPMECPRCGHELNPDVSFNGVPDDYGVDLLCENCGYIMDATKEFRELREANAALSEEEDDSDDDDDFYSSDNE